VRNFTEQSAKAIGMSFYDVKAQHGLLRNLMFRNSNTGEWMLLIQFHFEQPGDEQMAIELMQRISDKFPKISSLMYVDNQKGNDTIGDLELKTFKGTDFIYETMESLRFKVGPKSFYQTNTEQAYHLYSVARAFSLCDVNAPLPPAFPDETALQTAEQRDVNRKPLIYDLYTGTGTIANFMARYARRIIGIEYVPEAIEDAKTNSKVNKIDNTAFFAGDMKDILNDEFIRQHGTPDIVITDPPRAGMHPDVVNVILKAAHARIVYVSCNPATQARDLALLDAEYEVMAVQPVDMFPHTPHVENVVLLKKRNNNNI
ncbi:MAG: class I SAM-dependent RNA methyltransferase, partial [Prevotella sp.]